MRTLGAVGIACRTPCAATVQSGQGSATSTETARVRLSVMCNPRFHITSTPRDYGVVIYASGWDSLAWSPPRAGNRRAWSSAGMGRQPLSR
jgi:hypothetical protein